MIVTESGIRSGGVGALVEGTSMLTVVHERNQPTRAKALEVDRCLDEIVRDGAHQMLAAALRAK